MLKAFSTNEEIIKSKIKITKNCDKETYSDSCFKKHLEILKEISNAIDNHVDKIIQGEYEREVAGLYFGISNLLLDSAYQILHNGFITVSANLKVNDDLEEL